MADMEITLTVNGEQLRARVDPSLSLLAFLRENLGLVGTREGCGKGDCGNCTVLVDGQPALSCILFAFQASGRSVTTIEGVSEREKLAVIQECFIDKGAIQCGFCTPAMILSGKALLEKNPRPTREEIRRAISGVLCRCTGYRKIVDAIEETSLRQGGEQSIGEEQEGRSAYDPPSRR